MSQEEKNQFILFGKIRNKNKSLEQLSDLFGFRIYVDKIEDCYAVLGVFSSQNWNSSSRFIQRLYLNTKKNGYQSIHTTLVGPSNHRVEIQIRTNKMHEINERGVAAHMGL